MRSLSLTAWRSLSAACYVVAGLLVVCGLIITNSEWAISLVVSVGAFVRDKIPAPDWRTKAEIIGLFLTCSGIGWILFAWLTNSFFNQRLQTRFCWQLSRPTIQVGLIWALITVVLFDFNYMDNEEDVLPFARQFFDHGWLPNDWYLNLAIGYREAFNYFAGALVHTFGFQLGAIAGRLLIYLLFAVSFFHLFRVLCIRLVPGMLCILVFLLHQSLVAGEWMLGGLEAKSIAYALVILSMGAYMQNRLLSGAAFAGLALSLHMLIGGYALFCLGVALLASGALRGNWRRYLAKSWPFFITGCVGILAIFNHLSLQSEESTNAGWSIYVAYRVPHHLMPSAWEGVAWIPILSAGCVFFLLVFSIGKQHQVLRFVSAYAMASVVLFLIGLAIYASGELLLLRFYWFRFADVMVPFCLSILGARVVSVDATKWLQNVRLSRHLFPNGYAFVSQAGALLLIALAVFYPISGIYQWQLEERHLVRHRSWDTDSRLAFQWIGENTPRDSRFLIPPDIQDFYCRAERATFVTFKHAPQSEVDIREWYSRILQTNGGSQTKLNGIASRPELRGNFIDLTEQQIRRMSHEYDLSYLLTAPGRDLPFRLVYSNDSVGVYQID